MEMVKLVKGNRTIERPKLDYENNAKMWGIRGWELFVNKPKPEPIPEPEVKEDALSSELKEEKSFINVDSFNNKSTKHKKSKKKG